MPEDNIEKIEEEELEELEELEEEELEEQDSDLLDMSDEEFLKLSEDKLIPSFDIEEVETVTEDNIEIKEEVVQDQDQDTKQPSEKSSVSIEKIEEDKKDTEGDTLEDVVSTDIDYKAVYDKITSPFRANGVDMRIEDVDDAIRLMKMGANYHKKMSAIKPSLKTLKLLENNDLLDQEKLNYLIDIHKKDPKAITKLIKDSGIDIMDFNTEEESDYVPTNRQVSDKQIALDQVLDDLKSSPTYEKTLDVVVNKWDDKSKEIIGSTPEVLSAIDEHVANGTYEEVMSRVLYEKSLGRLSGLSDIEAYKVIGDNLHAQGKLTKYPLKLTTANVDTNLQTKMIEKKDNSSEAEAKRKERKKAVGTVRNTKPTSSKATFNPLAMSDEEFEKLDLSKFQI
jgi:hypothetical protein